MALFSRNISRIFLHAVLCPQAAAPGAAVSSVPPRYASEFVQKSMSLNGQNAYVLTVSVTKK